MASIQRIAASAVQAVAEASFSLFHANIDVSLVKYEVPAELLPLGDRLSKQRRQVAEQGSFNIFARRLGFLFEEVLPNVPALLKAYGTRASEIACEMDATDNVPKSIVEGIFGPHLGVDSTSIWAAANIGTSALLMHLLACMLARIWSSQEATAIWTELIEARRQKIKESAPGNDRSSAIVAQQAAIYDVDWSAIQNWDASARAWLQIADNSSHKLQQKQIELIANNLSIAIQTQVTPTGISVSAFDKGSVYDSVMLSFCSALSTLDNLILGKPQRILDGGVLLSLTSWHLYPDLVILGPKTQERPQQDPLVAHGGIATLSITYQEDPHGNQDGVYWSLPLAHLRYYKTIQRKRSSLHDSKISFTSLQALILGASLDSLDTLSVAADIIQSLWVFSYASYQDTLVAVASEWNTEPQVLVSEFFNWSEWNSRSAGALEQDGRQVSLWKPPAGPQVGGYLGNLHVLSALKGGVDASQSDCVEERKIALQLVRYGAHAAKSWIGNVGPSSFPFFGITDPVFLLQAIQRPFGRVRLLRTLFQQHCSEPEEYIIRFRKPNDTWGYASLSYPTASSTRKRDRAEFECDAAGDGSDLLPPEGEDWIFLPSKQDRPTDRHVFGEDYSLESMKPDEHQPQELVFAEFLDDNDPSTTVVWDLAIGIHNKAALYQRRDSKRMDNKLCGVSVALTMVRDLIKSHALDLEQVMNRFKDTLKTYRPNHHFPLLVLGRVINHYERHLPQLTLSMNIIKESPWSWAWAGRVVTDLPIQEMMASTLAREGHFTESIYPCPLSRQQVFASVLQFESGTLSVGVEEMDTVMAISSGNSLLIAQRILHDPIPPDGLPSCAVAHAIGNVGRPGIALLVAPKEPDIREHDVDKWHVVNHNPFDGISSRGMFEGSSLHMSFTGWEGALRVRGPSAFRGMEAYHLETRISMYDGAEWVADLDILRSLKESPNLSTLGIHNEACGHNLSVQSCGVKFVSIDCWEELLSPPEKPMVLRSGASWMARLTGVSIAFSRGVKCFLLPTDKEFCWTCVVEQSDIINYPGQTLFIY
ncbi:hypothetical protein HK57_00672 [Aspergillus ustus]|uniref:Uncharacterized protein n=1 Tax=Aspergillus ustus TaxID=40382 RepID=A0A0C1EFY4_ASPUT|nr:hypothetical protein HK57_00672 [Aspergillus ustus]